MPANETNIIQRHDPGFFVSRESNNRQRPGIYIINKPRSKKIYQTNESLPNWKYF